MNGTPRLRSAYPSSPRSARAEDGQNGATTGVSSPRVPLPVQSKPEQDIQAPMVPFTLVDAPSQRLYVASFYLGLILWRIWDYYGLVSDETDSFQSFMKWVVIDGVFLYSLPGLRIPWLQCSSTTTTMVFALHAILDYLLMFRVPVSRACSAIFSCAYKGF